MQRTNGKLGIIRVLRTRGRNYHFREISAVPIRIQIVSRREAVFAMPHAEPWFSNSFFELFFLWKFMVSRFLRNHEKRLMIVVPILKKPVLTKAAWSKKEKSRDLACKKMQFLLQFAVSNWLKVIIWKIISEVWDFHLQRQNQTDPIANFPVLLPVSQTPYDYVEFWASFCSKCHNFGKCVGGAYLFLRF